MAIKYTDEELIEAIKNSKTIAQTLRTLNLKSVGTNYKTIHNSIKRLNLDTSHFLGKSHNSGKSSWTKGKQGWSRISLEAICVENSTYVSSSELRRRLIKEKIFEEKCSMCLNTIWNNKPIPLHLDHINGINNDNRLSNLRLLCPNCHAQTPTYCVGNVVNRVKPKENFCICGKKIQINSKSCVLGCGQKRTKIEWPKIEILIEMLKTKPRVKIAKELGVSDNAIKKHIKFIPRSRSNSQ